MALILLRRDSESVVHGLLPVGDNEEHVCGTAGGTGRRRDPDFCCVSVCVGRKILIVELKKGGGGSPVLYAGANGGLEPFWIPTVFPDLSLASDADADGIPLYASDSTPLSVEVAGYCCLRWWPTG